MSAAVEVVVPPPGGPVAARRGSGKPLAGIGIALASVAGTVALRLALAPVLGQRSPFLVLTLALVISAWCGGRVAGVIALALTATAGALVSVGADLTALARADLVQSGLYLVVGSALLVLTDHARSTRTRLAGHVRALADTQRRDQRLLEATEERLQVAQSERARLQEAERRARADADAASRAKDEFLAVVSHELRTPLNALLGWASLLSRDPSPETRAKASSAIQRSARAQARLIEDLLDTSRMQAGRLTLDRRLIAVGPCVRAALGAIAPEAASKGVEISVSVPSLEPEPVVLGDPHRIEQIVTNLLTNAVRFTPAGRRIELAMRATDEAIEIEVRDEGEGIDPGLLAHVFDRFHQVDAGATRRHGGLGLGLSIVRHLVAEHGGTVEARSEGRGRGATFVVCLPSANAAALPATTVEPAASIGCALEGLKVLVVDDDGDGREVLGESLARAGATVHTASSVEQAWRELSEGSWIPDVLVSDLAMPEVDGVELVRRVRTLPPSVGGAVPALAVSAHARRADRSRASDAGFDRHLSKPVDPDALVRTVAELARRAPAGAEPRIGSREPG